jgi:hypothetical protein
MEENESNIRQERKRNVRLWIREMKRVRKRTKEEKCKGDYKEWKIDYAKKQMNDDKLERIWKEEIVA